MSLRHRNIECELNQIFYFLLSPSPCTKSTIPPEHTTVSSLRMPPSPGKSEDNPYFCKCKKCALQGGRVLLRATWYRHNPGGKGVKRPRSSFDDIEHLINLPASKFSRIRRQQLEERHANLVSKRGAGSSSVRMTSAPIYALIFTETYT